MKFGAIPVEEAEGTILAHSRKVGETRLKKGRILTVEDIERLRAASVAEVVVARLDHDDMREDDAALAIATRVLPDTAADHLTRQAPFTGRVNIHAERTGILMINIDAVARLNSVDPAITLATGSHLSRAEAGALVGTVKILPFAVPGAAVEAASAALGADPVLRLAVPVRTRVTLVSTRVPGMKDSIIEKGRAVVEARLAALGAQLVDHRIVPHTEADLRDTLTSLDDPGDLVLIMGGSATQDPMDVGPASVISAGGSMIRFGMPVDPGNLLFLADVSGRPLVGLPGCARSPALNGADWVLERLICGIDVSSADIAAMGVGGLLKEIPSRPQPRSGPPPTGRKPKVDAIVLAAGESTRMRGRDKLMEQVEGEPLLRRIVKMCNSAQVRRVITIVPDRAHDRVAVVNDLQTEIVENPLAAEGMASSVRAGVARLDADCDAALIILADMPELDPSHLDSLIAAFSPADGREICRAIDETGKPGHPVLFGRRFFEPLASLSGDQGARNLLTAESAFVVDVETNGRGATCDLDTPEEWAAWKAAGPSGAMR